MALTPQIALVAIAAGAVVGIVSALMGVGGGLLMVPLMVIGLGESQHVAEGTSLLVIVPTAVAGCFAHRRSDFIAWRAAAFLAAGGLGGAYLGADLALRLPAERLRLLFGLFLAIIGIGQVVQSLRARPRG